LGNSLPTKPAQVAESARKTPAFDLRRAPGGATKVLHPGGLSRGNNFHCPSYPGFVEFREAQALLMFHACERTDCL
jgi:hypothetical protein